MMVAGERPKPWFKENATLIYFLLAQLVAFGTAAASILAYSVRLETRVSIMEDRGAAYTVSRMDEMKMKISVLEQQIQKNEASINRLINEFLKDKAK
jgi:hypothetical protein